MVAVPSRLHASVDSRFRARTVGGPVCLLLSVALAGPLGCGRPVADPSMEPGGHAANELTGRVVSHRGHGLPGARVRYKGLGPSVLSDAQGNFRLPLSAEAAARKLPVTAALPGYFIAGHEAVEGLRIELEPLPDEDHDDYAWVDPTPDETAALNCGNCHREIHAEWQAGGHARGTSSRHFLNLYDGSTWQNDEPEGWGLLTEYPEGAGVCSACHAPAARLDQLGVADIRTVEGVARQGVHCDFCHKVRDVQLDAVGLAHGRFAMNLLRPREGQVFIGPLDDVDRGEDSYSPLYRDSRICAPCHEGVVFGVPVYTTYSEWLQSPARAQGQHCQSCHMRPTGQMTNFAPDVGGIERDPLSLASHSLMPDGQQAMLRRCLQLTGDLAPDGDATRLTLSVLAQHVGHHVPTGFVDRHVLLVVQASDANGGVLQPKDGPRLPAAAGDLAGQSGVLFAKLLVDAEGTGPVPFWRNGARVDDTRLQPGVPRTIEFRLPSATSEVRVRLLYRRFWQPTAQQKHWPDPTLEIVDRTWSVSATPQ